MSARQKSPAVPRHFTRMGEYLRAARTRAGLSRDEVSEALGYLNAQNVSNIECGLLVPPLKKLEVLIKLYKLDGYQLLDIILEEQKAMMIGALFPKEKRKRSGSR